MRTIFYEILHKTSEFMKTLKKTFKKREIAIYAVALMLVAAGYYNYSTLNQEAKETISEIENTENNTNIEHIGDAVLVNSDETENIEENYKKTDQEQSEQTEAVDSTQVESNENYYANTKLERDKMYAEIISNYEAILNNMNVSEAQKSIATTEITKINNIKNMIMICENLILTKEFENCVILINEASVNVVVQTENGLNTQKVAQIQNIISREMQTEIENIHISEK